MGWTGESPKGEAVRFRKWFRSVFLTGYWDGYRHGYWDGEEEIKAKRADLDAEIMAGIQYDIWQERKRTLVKENS
jgi:hypothetical protein